MLQNSRMILFISSMLLVVGLFSMDLYNPSLPAITKDLHVTQTLTRGLVIAYLFGLSISQLVYGPCSDTFGRKKIIFISLVLTIFGNLFTATATTGDQLLAYRFLTGLGAGGCPVISRAILRDVFQDKRELTKAFSIFTMVAQVSPAFAPVIGGVIEEYYSWQINFIVLSVIGGAALILLFFLFKETHFNKKSFNFKNMLTDYKQLFSNKLFVSYSVMSALVYAYTVGYYTINPFVFQNEYAFGPLANGMIYVLYSAGLFFGAYLTNKLANRHSPEKILHYSTLLLIVVSFLIPLIGIKHSALMLIVFSTLIAILCGCAAPILLSLSILPFSEIAGSASALQGSIKMLGTALTLLFLLIFHVETSEELSMIFFVISLLLIPLFLLTDCINTFKRKTRIRMPQ